MRNQCILYVEDDENERFLMRHAFKAADIRQPLHVVADGEQAITYLSDACLGGCGAGDLIPCLVLLDLHLPGISGLEVLEWIRSQPGLTTLVVILFSSSQDTRDVESAYRLGANSFISKPRDLSKHLQFARLLKGWWLECNQFSEADEVYSHSSYASAGALAHSPA